MTTKQINDILLQIANLEGQIAVHEERIEQETEEVEDLVFHGLQDNLDASDLEEINHHRTSYMLEFYKLEQCRKKIVSLKKAAGVDLDEIDTVFDE